MTFRIRGLSADLFRPLYGLDDEALARAGARRYRVDSNPGFPDRVSMLDAEVGETVLLLNHVSHDVRSPYRTAFAIFVREGALERYDAIGEIPPVMRSRLLSLRGFDQQGMLIEANVVEGRDVESLIAQLFANPGIAYIHAHNARQGCYSGLIERA